jgi:hypothetical protein
MKKLILAVVLILVFTSVASAQTPNFLFLRGGGSSPVLANYNLTFDGNKVVWLGTLQDQTVDPAYREFQVGLGRAFGTSQVFALALRASDGWYLQLVGTPSISRGRLSASAFVADYIPLQDGEVKQLLIDPATVLVKMAGRLSVGASYTMYKAQGLALKHAVGPTLQVVLPKGSVNIDFFEGLSGNYRREVRITFQLAF